MALPKLNLRDLFWLAVVVAMGLGWWVDRREQQRRMDAQERRVLAEQREFEKRLHPEQRQWLKAARRRSVNVVPEDSGLDSGTP
jgi:hypothetical protein